MAVDEAKKSNGSYGSRGLAAGNEYDATVAVNALEPVFTIVIANPGGTIEVLEDMKGNDMLPRFDGLIENGNWPSNLPITAPNDKPFGKIGNGASTANLALYHYQDPITFTP